MTENPGRGLVIDAGGLAYISSAGLRVLLQTRKKLDKPLTVREVSPEVQDIFQMTGFTDLLDVKKKLREFSVEGCKVIGRGAIGTGILSEQGGYLNAWGVVMQAEAATALTSLSSLWRTGYWPTADFHERTIATARYFSAGMFPIAEAEIETHALHVSRHRR